MARTLFPAALQLLARVPGGRPTFVEILDAALAGDPAQADRFVEALGPVALEPDVIEKVLPLAGRLPAAAEVAAASDHGLAPEVVDGRLDSKDARWRIAAVRSLRFLSAEEVFERVSGLFVAPDRNKPVAPDRLGTVLGSATPMESPRWLVFLTARLAQEEHPKLRGMLVSALGALGLPAVDAIVGAATDDADPSTLKEIPWALERLRGDLTRRGQWEGEGVGVIAIVRAAAASATPKGPRQKTLKRALLVLDR